MRFSVVGHYKDLVNPISYLPTGQQSRSLLKFVLGHFAILPVDLKPQLPRKFPKTSSVSRQSMTFNQIPVGFGNGSTGRLSNFNP